MPRKAQTKTDKEPKTARRSGRPPKVQAEPVSVSHSTDIRTFALELVQPNPWQPRVHFDDEYIRELAVSIKANGLQEYPAGRVYGDLVQLAYGHQRFMAFQQLAVSESAFAEIPIVVREYSDEEMAFAGLEENRSRRNLTPIEEARAMKIIMDSFKTMGPTELGRRMGMHKTTVSNAVKTLELPEDILAKGEGMGLALGTLRELIVFQSPDHVHEEIMHRVLNLMVGKGVTTREALIAELHEMFEYQWTRDRLPEKFKPLRVQSHDGASFDVNAFEKEHKAQVHHIHKLFPVTCAVKEWDAAQKEVEQAEREHKVSGPTSYGLAEVIDPPDDADVDQRPEQTQEALLEELKGMIDEDHYEIVCTVEDCGMEGFRLEYDSDEEEPSRFRLMIRHVVEVHAVPEEAFDLTTVEDPQEEFLTRRPMDDTVILLCLVDHKRWAVLQPDYGVRREISEFQEGRRPEFTVEQFTYLVPQETKAPTAGKKALPEGFDLGAQQTALKALNEGLAEAHDVAAYLRLNAEQVVEALGSRAEIVVKSKLQFNEYESLRKSNIEQIADPSECVKSCTWGFALANTSDSSDKNPLRQDIVCLNKTCFGMKKRKLSQAKNKRGKEGIEREDAQVEMAANEIARRGTMVVGRVEAIMLLEVIGTGQDWVGSGQVYWRHILAAHMNIDEKDAKEMSDVQMFKALAGREEDELRYLVSAMLLERFRSRAKPAEWEPRLAKRLGELELGHVTQVEVAEPAEPVGAKDKKGGAKKS